MRIQNKKAAIAFMLAAMMAVPSISGAKALAADDSNEQVIVDATSEDKNVEVGDITSDDYGLHVNTGDGKTVTVTTGNIESDDDGIYVDKVGKGSDVTITTGNIESEDVGVYVYEIKNDSDVTITTGNIESEDNGVFAYSIYEDSDLTITTDDIESGFYGVYVGSIRKGSNATVTTGDISSDRYGIYACNFYEGTLDMSVDGSISASNEGVHLYLDDGGTATVTVKGDVKASDYGLYFDTDDDNSTADVLIEGTVEGDKGGVRLRGDHGFEAENLSLTVWRIKPNADDEIVDVYNDTYPDMKEEFEDKIMYIIKVEQPTEGGTIAVSDKDGNALDKSHDCDVANQGDKVLVKVNPEEHYKITGAYNGVDGAKLELLKDENGNYYVEVPKGGGVYLTAVLEKEKYDISFYDDDGNLIQTNTVEYGDTITIPDAPTREGYELLYWEGSKYYPGDQYTVTGPHTFKAVWKKIEDKATDDTEDKKETTDKSDDKKDDTAAPTGTTYNTSKPVASSPATDDATNIMMLIIIMIVSASGAVIAANLKKRLNRKED